VQQVRRTGQSADRSGRPAHAGGRRTHGPDGRARRGTPAGAPARRSAATATTAIGRRAGAGGVRRNGLTLARLGHSDLTAPNPGFNEFGSTAMWNATAGQSRMTVTVTKAACTDGMSDRAYPYAAKVTVWGATLSGCAARPAG